ncbi:MAG: hypothetical protein ACRDSF_04560 [Pseudonocardiaceae bacterium]
MSTFPQFGSPRLPGGFPPAAVTAGTRGRAGQARQMSMATATAAAAGGSPSWSRP